MTFNLDSASKGLTIASLALAVLAAWKAVPLDADLKALQAETQRLDNELKIASAKLAEAETQLKQAEAGRKLSFDLYQEVKQVLEKKDRTPRDEEALRVLVEALADDPFRYKLLSVLAVGASSPSVKQSATESSTFFQEEAQLNSRQRPSGAENNLARPTQGLIGNYDVDVFYCSGRQASSQPLAEKAKGLKNKDETGRWRLRSLPESINQQPGYGVSTNEIRFNAPDELPVARILQERLAGAGIQARLRETLQPTKWYVSIFICQ